MDQEERKPGTSDAESGGKIDIDKSYYSSQSLNSNFNFNQNPKLGNRFTSLIKKIDLSLYGRLNEAVDFKQVFKVHCEQFGYYQKLLMILLLLQGFIIGCCYSTFSMFFRLPTFYYLDLQGKKIFEKDLKKVCADEKRYTPEYVVYNIVMKFKLYCVENSTIGTANDVLIVKGVTVVISGIIAFLVVKLADNYGRKFMFRIGAILSVLGFLMASVMNKFWTLLTGLSVGYSGMTGMLFLGFLILNENIFQPNSFKWNFYLLISFVFGGFLTDTLTLATFRNYQQYLYYTSVCSFIGLLGTFYFLESYELLYDKKESFEFSRVVATIQARNGFGKKINNLLSDLFRPYAYGTLLDTDSKSSDINDLVDKKARALSHVKNSITRGSNLKKVILSTILLSNIFVIYIATLRERSLIPGLDEEANDLLVRIWNIMILLIIHRKAHLIKRKTAFVASSIILTLIGLILFLMSPMVFDFANALPRLRCILVCLVARTLSLSLIPIIFPYIYDMFSPSIRGTCLSIAAFVDHLTIGASFFVSNYLNRNGFDGIFPFFVLSPVLLFFTPWIQEQFTVIMQSNILDERKNAPLLLKLKESNMDSD